MDPHAYVRWIWFAGFLLFALVVTFCVMLYVG
jgi:hypothetical protein